MNFTSHDHEANTQVNEIYGKHANVALNAQEFRLKVPEDTEIRYHCDFCGQDIQKGENPCPNCGKRLNWCKKSSLLSDGICYWLSEAAVVSYAFACVEIVLLHSHEADTLYREAVNAWSLTGCQDLVEATLTYMPSKTALFIESIRPNKKNGHEIHDSFFKPILKTKYQPKQSDIFFTFKIMASI